MSKKQTTEVIETKHRPSGELVAEASVRESAISTAETTSRTSGTFEFTMQDALVAEQLGMVLSGSTPDRLTRAVTTYNQAARLTVEAGYLLLSVRADVEHGQFLTELGQLGLSNQRAYELMQSAKFISSVPEARRVELLTLPKSKVLALAGADPAVIEQMLEDGNVTDLDDMSVRGLRLRIRELEDESAKRSKRLEAELEHRDAVIQKLKKKEIQREFDPLTHMVRDECLAYQGGIELNVQSLGALFDEVIKDSPDAPEWRLRLEQIWFAAHAAAARATALLQRVRDEMPLDMPEQATTPNMLTPDETFQWVLEWETMTSQAKVSAAVRAELRAQDGPRGVGRPKGSKAVKADKA